MNRIHKNWRVPVSGALLFATAVSAEQDLQTYLNSTNRVTISLRLGMNISGSFRGPSTIYLPMHFPAAGGRHTPNGDPYNYDDGYVLKDISGNAGGQTWYWGYDNTKQVDIADHTITFDRTTVPNQVSGAGGNQSDDLTRVGAELSYYRELGVKDDWHGFRYGLEAAVNFMPISFSGSSESSVPFMHTVDTYSFTPGTTPPGFDNPSELPYQGTFQGPNFVINVPAVSSVSAMTQGGTFLIQQKFDANLWGFRLGPYVELPLSKRWSLHLSGGLAVGLLDGNMSWNETFIMPNNGKSISVHGGGDNAEFLWGGYVNLQAQYQISQRWGLEAGVQFQDLGTYDHNFGSRGVQVDLSRSIFVHAGISFSF
jgi:hypothetical protein